MVSLLDILRVRVDEIKSQIVTKDQILNGWEVRRAKHLAPEEYEFIDPDWLPLNVHDVWAKQGETAFIRRNVRIPEDWAGLRVGLELVTDGEGLLRIDGEPRHGVDDNRGYILLAPSAQGSENFVCEIEIRTGGQFAFVINPRRRTQPGTAADPQLCAICSAAARPVTPHFTNPPT